MNAVRHYGAVYNCSFGREEAVEPGWHFCARPRCCIQREIDNKLISPAGIGCFPNVYAALGGVGVDQVITL